MAKGSIFVDTSAWYALIASADPEHGAAKAIWARLTQDRPELFTSDWVLAELIALSERRLGRFLARRIGSLILKGDAVRVVFVDSRVLEQAWRVYGELGGPSLVDCVSFESMRNSGIERYFAFDADFGRAGFKSC